MKYGVICTSQTRNIGDDIQSLAAIYFLRKNGITDYVCVEREELNSYSGEPLALITNGWFLHKFQNFPPSGKIKPLFIGFYSHYPSLIEKHREYFKKHEPRQKHGRLSLCETIRYRAVFVALVREVFVGGYW